MTAGDFQDTTPVGAAVDAARLAMTELIATVRQGGLDHHDPAGLVELLYAVEVLRNQWQAVDADLLAVCRDRGVAERECQRSMAKVLERRFLVGPHEASRRVNAAAAVGPRVSMTGLPLPRLRPEVSDAMSAGTITSEQSALVCKTLDQLDQTAPAKVHEVETVLVEHCQLFAPRELNRSVNGSWRSTTPTAPNRTSSVTGTAGSGACGPPPPVR